MSITMKERWAKCEAAAKVLGLSKHDVYNAGKAMFVLIPAILEGDETVIEKAKALPRYTQYRPKQLKRESRKTSKSPGQAGSVRIMLWAIDKIGSVEKAEEAFVKAKSIVSE